MSHSLWFHPLTSALVGAGIKVVGADRRGSGLNTRARGDAPSAKALVDDVLTIIARERAPNRPLHLAGWCWGAVLAINVCAELRDDVASLVLLAPGLFPTRELKERAAAEEEAARTRGALDPAEPCLASPIAEEMFTSGPALADFIRTDPHRLTAYSSRFAAVMAKLGMGARLKLPGLAARLPLLLVLASDDRATDNEATEHGLLHLTENRVTVERVKSAHGIQFDAPDELALGLITWIVHPRGDHGRA
jgi:alpha-beta hydrolase superfamily lysophospholipase